MNDSTVMTDRDPLTYSLPPPKTDGDVSLEYALARRRSQRHLTGQAISAECLGQLLWSAYGVTSPQPSRPLTRGGFRTAPSAGGLYPLEIDVVIGNVDGIEPGVYRYASEDHKIIRRIDQDIRDALCAAALGQVFVKEAPITVAYSGIFDRTTKKYGERGLARYVWLDAGHSAENLCLQVEVLNLGACAVGAFDDDKVAELMQYPVEETPMYMVAIGHKRERV
jgi:SagB-type dehydrogenase domain